MISRRGDLMSALMSKKSDWNPGENDAKGFDRNSSRLVSPCPDPMSSGTPNSCAKSRIPDRLSLEMGRNEKIESYPVEMASRALRDPSPVLRGNAWNSSGDT